MADRKELIKELKRSHASLVDALDNVIASHLALKVHEKAKSGKKKAKPEAKGEAAAPVEEEPWTCSGNVLTGDACPGGEGSLVRAADTRHEHKAHPTCKLCKKAIGKTRAAERAAAQPVLEAEPADE